MPTYCFRNLTTGERRELIFPIRKAPRYGQVITVDGDRLERVLEDTANVVAPFKPYVTHCLPKRTPGFKHAPDGKCVVETAAQERAYAKETGMEWS